MSESRHSALRIAAFDRLVWFSRRGLDHAYEHNIDPMALARRLAAVDPGTVVGPRRFRGADGLMCIAMPIRKTLGWRVITTFWSAGKIMAERRDYCLTCGGENEPQDEDQCPACGGERGL